MKAGGLKLRAELELDRFALDPYCKLYLPLWKLDGDSFADHSAYGHLCTKYGTGTAPPAHWTPQGWSFDGVDDYVITADSLDFAYFTVETWAKFDTLGFQHIVANRVSSGDYKFDLWTGEANETNPKLRLGVVVGGVQVYMGGSEAGTIMSANKWYHCVGVFDGSKIYTYLNGALDYSKNATGSLTSKTDPVTIGRAAYDASNYTDGLIGEVRIYSRALTPQEILDHYIIGKEMFG